MKNQIYFNQIMTGVVLSYFLMGCNSPASTPTPAAKTPEVAVQAPPKPDLAKIKMEIQALETAWSQADNVRDTNTIAAFYSDDAKSLGENEPILVGKSAIRKDIVTSLKKRVKGSTVAYDVMDVYGDENVVTEVGTTTRKDASGKVTYTGKYMAIWEKRNGKYICVRDISNSDVKQK